MRFNLSLVLCLCIIQCLNAQSVKVYGKIKNPTGPKVNISYYKDQIAYQKVLADTAHLNQEGEFVMHFEWSESAFAEFFHGNEYTPLFLSPGDSLRIELDAQKFDETVRHTGKGSLVNNYLASKLLQFPPGTPTYFQLAEGPFLHYVDSVRDYKLNFLKQHFLTSNKDDHNIRAFMNTEEAEIYYDHVGEKLNYSGYHAYFKQLKEPVVLHKDYYNFLNQVRVVNPEAMKSSSYLSFVGAYIDREVMNAIQKDSTLSAPLTKQKMIDRLLTDEIKSHILAEYAFYLFSKVGDLENGILIYQKYLNESKNKKYKDILEKAYRNAEKLAKGKPAPEFRLQDLNGNFVSLKDFKGKIIYMDIWASWCGPCMREVPYAKKLEEEMHGKDVVFLNISIDENPEAWKKAVKEKEIKGVHIHSKGGKDAQFAEAYQVQGIPRYFIIDKNGLIADSNAKRPSGNVKADLESLLMVK